MEFWSLMLRRGGLKGVIGLRRCPPPPEAFLIVPTHPSFSAENVVEPASPPPKAPALRNATGGSHPLETLFDILT